MSDDGREGAGGHGDGGAEGRRRLHRAVAADLDHAAWLHARLAQMAADGTPRWLFEQWEGAITDGLVAPPLQTAFMLWAQAPRSAKKARHRPFFERRVAELIAGGVPWPRQPAGDQGLDAEEQAALEAEAAWLFAIDAARPGAARRRHSVYRGTAWEAAP